MKALLLALLACGPPPAGISANMRMSLALSASQVQSMYIWVLAPTAGDLPLTCDGLKGSTLTRRGDLFTHGFAFGPFGDTRLDSVRPGRDLIIAIETYANVDGSGARNGFGCREGVAIVSNKTAVVNIDVDALP